MQQTKNLFKSPYLLLSLSSLFWALNQVFGRGLRDEIPPMAFAFWRWAIAMTVLAAFASIGIYLTTAKRFSPR